MSTTQRRDRATASRALPAVALSLLTAAASPSPAAANTRTFGNGRSITLIAPRAGQVFSQEQGIVIQWTTRGVPRKMRVALQYRLGRGRYRTIADWLPVDHRGPTGPGSYRWRPRRQLGAVQLRIVYRGALKATQANMIAAIKARDHARVRSLLKLRRQLARTVAQRWPALHWAVGMGHAGIVRDLVRAGARLEAPGGNNGLTPLASAASTGKLAMVRLLLSLGANVNAVDRRRMTPLMLARKKGHRAIAKLLARRRAIALDLMELYKRLKRRDFATAKKMLRKAPQLLRGRWSSGATILHTAATNGMPRAVALLLRLKAKVNIRDRKGETPLHRAVRRLGSKRVGAYLQVIRALLARGADPNALDYAGHSPFSHLVRRGDVALIKQLVSRGANVKQANRQGRTPLHAAGQACNIAVARVLLKAGADRRAKDNQGKTAARLARSRAKALQLKIRKQLTSTKAELALLKRCQRAASLLSGFN